MLREYPSDLAIHCATIEGVKQIHVAKLVCAEEIRQQMRLNDCLGYRRRELYRAAELRCLWVPNCRSVAKAMIQR